MGEGPNTRASLLVRLRDHRDADAWRQFVGLYGPMVFRFARKRGLQEADAADFTQTVFQAVAGAIPEFDYDPRQGRFRGWLFAVVRRQLQKFLEKQARAIVENVTYLDGELSLIEIDGVSNAVQIRSKKPAPAAESGARFVEIVLRNGNLITVEARGSALHVSRENYNRLIETLVGLLHYV